MKLVDILARELKEWPDCARYILFDHANSCYADLGQGYSPLGIDCSDFDDDATDKSCTTVYRAQWQAAVDALRAENCAHLWVGWSDTEACELCNKTRKIIVEWNGDGLPPVGTVCELNQRVLLAGEDDADWFEEGTKVEIGDYAIFDGSTGHVCAVRVVDDNYTGTLSEVCLRPIKTPEQIAAEERTNNAIAMCEVTKGAHGWMEAFRMLHDAGYRKFKIVEGEE